MRRSYRRQQRAASAQPVQQPVLTVAMGTSAARLLSRAAPGCSPGLERSQVVVWTRREAALELMDTT
jgi:hypothetical protein